jgi:type IV pilus assembly protein PilA
MTALQAYLQNSRTRKVLSKKPGEAGFSLIELVVVVAVLAVLATIAIPAFTNVSDKAAHAAAKTSLAAIVKECQVKITDGEAAPTHGSVSGSGGVYFVVDASKCFNTASGVNTGVVMVACANKGTAASYAANLLTGAKVAAGTTVTVATTPSGAVSCPSTASAW